MIKNDDKTALAINLLKSKAEELGRTPKKEDFDSDTVCFIKQKLGPFPRALEKAGLKNSPDISAKEKSKIKRTRIEKNKKKMGKRGQNEV
jgi:pyruvate carboxylase